MNPPVGVENPDSSSDSSLYHAPMLFLISLYVRALARLLTPRRRDDAWKELGFFVGEGDVDAARELVESTDQAELFLYPGDQHYFADSRLPSYDPDAAALLTKRVLDFLGGL